MLPRIYSMLSLDLFKRFRNESESLDRIFSGISFFFFFFDIAEDGYYIFVRANELWRKAVNKDSLGL